MKLRTWCKVEFSITGKQKKGIKQSFPIIEYCCDDCNEIWEESSKYESKYVKWGGHYCSKCLHIRNMKKFSECGTIALSKLTKLERKVNASMGGTATQISPNRNVKSFTTDRWNKMTKEERNNQVNTAYRGLVEKLKNPEYRNAHFEKIFKNSKIGYISKGQREVFNLLIENEMFDFHLDGVLSNMKVDIISFTKKIAIEYNGDYYHCNPRTWSPNEFNKSIKMIASKKWELDRLRRFQLMRMGYNVIVIWESEWKKNKEKYINRIKEKYYETN